MRVWITKHALSKGIIEAKIDSIFRTGEIITIEGDCLSTYYHGEGIEWHRTRESAVIQAEKMRNNRLESLKKQIKKLEAMRFE